MKPGVPGITVTLTGGGDDGVIGTADDTTETQQTTELGGYLFQDLTPGEEYQVTFSNLPEGYEFSPADQGLDDELDSDVDAAGQTQIIVLGSDEDNRIDRRRYFRNGDSRGDWRLCVLRCQ